MTKSLLEELASRGIFHSLQHLEIYDEAEGVFGDLIDSERVVQTLQHDSNVDVNVGSPEHDIQSFESLRSLSYDSNSATFDPNNEKDEIFITVDNMSSCYLRIRWIDHQGHCPSSTHLWTVRPSSTFQQFTRPGHLFLLTVMETTPGEDEEDLFDTHLMTSSGNEGRGREKEKILGAYRPKMSLPSRLPHNILVEGTLESGLIMEVLLLDDTKKDALTVASALLDEMHTIHPRNECQHTIRILLTIITNILDHPHDTKYRKLRLSNKSIQRHIANIWPAMDFLKASGFQRMKEEDLPTIAMNDRVQQEKQDKKDGEQQHEEGDEKHSEEEHKDEEYLILPYGGGAIEEHRIVVLTEAKKLLDVLSTRLQDNFIADIAPPVPWQAPVVLSGGGGTSRTRSTWGRRALHFINDEERWHRAELNRRRRGRAGRRPNPGQAPSSRGTWGR